MTNTIKTLIFVIIIVIVSIIIDLPNGPDLKIKSFYKEIKTHLGLDLQGGTHLVYELDTSKLADEDKNDAAKSVIDVIDKRVNSLGVSEPVIQEAEFGGKSAVIVELPGIKDVKKATDLIGRTAQLSFYEQANTSDSNQLSVAASSKVPGWIETNLNGSHLKKAEVKYDQTTGDPYIAIQFNSEGQKIFSELTKKLVGKPMAIVLDDQVISAPTVQDEITSGSAIINGEFSIQEAKEVTKLLNAGALPVPVKLVEQRNIGALLGIDSVKKSAVAGIVGFLLIAIFMTLNYKLPGFLATVSLAIYGLILLALFKLIPVTLTLAGITGFIISFGMAIDANVLIFSRMKEEITKGMPKSTALDEGFSRAWSSIIDSNLTTLITCGILYIYTTGMVRGFALTLGLGIIVSIFSAITITKTFLKLLINTKFEKYLSL